MCALIVYILLKQRTYSGCNPREWGNFTRQMCKKRTQSQRVKWRLIVYGSSFTSNVFSLSILFQSASKLKEELHLLNGGRRQWFWKSKKPSIHRIYVNHLNTFFRSGWPLSRFYSCNTAKALHMSIVLFGFGTSSLYEICNNFNSQRKEVAWSQFTSVKYFVVLVSV